MGDLSPFRNMDESKKKKLLDMGLKMGAIKKIESVYISGCTPYAQTSTGNITENIIKSVTPTPMDKNWKPSDDDLDLTAECKDTGSDICSVKNTMLKMTDSSWVPRGLKHDTNCFYIKSTNHSLYFKLLISWGQD